MQIIIYIRFDSFPSVLFSLIQAGEEVKKIFE